MEEAAAAPGKRKRSAVQSSDFSYGEDMKEEKAPPKEKKDKPAKKPKAAPPAPPPAAPAPAEIQPEPAEMTQEEVALMECYKELRTIRAAVRRSSEDDAEQKARKSEKQKADLVDLLKSMKEEDSGCVSSAGLSPCALLSLVPSVLLFC